MDLSAIDKYKINSLTRFDFMKLFYESIITVCDELNIISIDVKNVCFWWWIIKF